MSTTFLTLSCYLFQDFLVFKKITLEICKDLAGSYIFIALFKILHYSAKRWKNLRSLGGSWKNLTNIFAWIFLLHHGDHTQPSFRRLGTLAKIHDTFLASLANNTMTMQGPAKANIILARIPRVTMFLTSLTRVPR